MTEGRVPVWSPDGNDIAFLSDGYTCMINANGNQKKQLTTEKWEKEHYQKGFRMVEEGIYVALPSNTSQKPDWSPSGEEIAFSVNGNIAILDVESLEIEKILISKFIDKNPKWSPDGSQLLFNSNRSGGWNMDQLFLVDRTGDNIEQLTTRKEYSYTPHIPLDWSPTGDWIVVDMWRDGVGLISPDGAKRMFLTTVEECYLAHASFSPDGQWLVLACDETDIREAGIYFLNIEQNKIVKMDVEFDFPVGGFSGIDWASPTE